MQPPDETPYEYPAPPPIPYLPAPVPQPPLAQITSQWRAMQSAADVVGLGGQMVGSGMSSLAAQGLIDKLQRRSMATAMDSAAEVLDEVRKVMQAELDELVRAIRGLPSYAPTMPAVMLQGLRSGRGGHAQQLIEKDAVIAAITAVANRVVRP